MRKVSLTLLILLAAECYAQEPPIEPKLLSICELFEDLRSYAGKTIAVRGLLYQGKEVFALGGQRCQSRFVTRYLVTAGLPLPGTEVVTAEYSWPTTINLTWSGSSFPEGELPAPFSTDSDSIRRTTAFIVKQRAELANVKEGVDVFVTVVGMLRVRSHYVIGRLPNGEPHGAGYGHLSYDPAELVIRTMRDPEVVIRKPEETGK